MVWCFLTGHPRLVDHVLDEEEPPAAGGCHPRELGLEVGGLGAHRPGPAVIGDPGPSRRRRARAPGPSTGRSARYWFPCSIAFIVASPTAVFSRSSRTGSDVQSGHRTLDPPRSPRARCRARSPARSPPAPALDPAVPRRRRRALQRTIVMSSSCSAPGAGEGGRGRRARGLIISRPPRRSRPWSPLSTRRSRTSRARRRGPRGAPSRVQEHAVPRLTGLLLLLIGHPRHQAERHAAWRAAPTHAAGRLDDRAGRGRRSRSADRPLAGSSTP